MSTPDEDATAPTTEVTAETIEPMTDVQPALSTSSSSSSSSDSDCDEAMEKMSSDSPDPTTEDSDNPISGDDCNDNASSSSSESEEPAPEPERPDYDAMRRQLETELEIEDEMRDLKRVAKGAGLDLKLQFVDTAAVEEEDFTNEPGKNHKEKKKNRRERQKGMTRAEKQADNKRVRQLHMTDEEKQADDEQELQDAEDAKCDDYDRGDGFIVSDNDSEIHESDDEDEVARQKRKYGSFHHGQTKNKQKHKQKIRQRKRLISPATSEHDEGDEVGSNREDNLRTLAGTHPTKVIANTHPERRVKATYQQQVDVAQHAASVKNKIIHSEDIESSGSESPSINDENRNPQQAKPPPKKKPNHKSKNCITYDVGSICQISGEAILILYKGEDYVPITGPNNKRGPDLSSFNPDLWCTGLKMILQPDGSWKRSDKWIHHFCFGSTVPKKYFEKMEYESWLKCNNYTVEQKEAYANEALKYDNFREYPMQPDQCVNSSICDKQIRMYFYPTIFQTIQRQAGLNPDGSTGYWKLHRPTEAPDYTKTTYQKLGGVSSSPKKIARPITMQATPSSSSSNTNGSYANSAAKAAQLKRQQAALLSKCDKKKPRGEGPMRDITAMFNHNNSNQSHQPQSQVQVQAASSSSSDSIIEHLDAGLVPSFSSSKPTLLHGYNELLEFAAEGVKHHAKSKGPGYTRRFYDDFLARIQKAMAMPQPALPSDTPEWKRKLASLQQEFGKDTIQLLIFFSAFLCKECADATGLSDAHPLDPFMEDLDVGLVPSSNLPKPLCMLWRNYDSLRLFLAEGIKRHAQNKGPNGTRKFYEDFLARIKRGMTTQAPDSPTVATNQWTQKCLNMRHEFSKEVVQLLLFMSVFVAKESTDVVVNMTSKSDPS
jgi:hypothetical protein